MHEEGQKATSHHVGYQEMAAPKAYNYGQRRKEVKSWNGRAEEATPKDRILTTLILKAYGVSSSRPVTCRAAPVEDGIACGASRPLQGGLGIILGAAADWTIFLIVLSQ